MTKSNLGSNKIVHLHKMKMTPLLSYGGGGGDHKISVAYNLKVLSDSICGKII